MSHYLIKTTHTVPPLTADWKNPAWDAAALIEIKHFRPESTHHPRTIAKLLYDAEGIHGIFRVEDQFVCCRRQNYMDEVWKDSCVEFFVEPKPGKGYFNFEFNCGGAFLCNHITDPTRIPNGFKESVKIPKASAQVVKVCSSLPVLLEKEITEPLEWSLQFFIPFRFFTEFIGSVQPLTSEWRGNFFKCADESSHPHWASWCPVDEFNFHLPRCFGAIHFDAVQVRQN